MKCTSTDNRMLSNVKYNNVLHQSKLMRIRNLLEICKIVTYLCLAFLRWALTSDWICWFCLIWRTTTHSITFTDKGIASKRLVLHSFANKQPQTFISDSVPVYKGVIWNKSSQVSKSNKQLSYRTPVILFFCLSQSPGKHRTRNYFP